ncbi:uncharacterized protein CcaverHIS019_0201330 [Cutaneotrichosporon cavernicola]|uniref:RING-type domain-containing protein n=1 Tax=Cutaneotrichosporon cavernicola TaxID=279322 RepID=A0AA48ID58_9TREE|nr:uncharacterized protein CcaverHIS019_0201330 [Cutaneotrichosporon cavernicola]BEI88771.1 hypothetical protein CcaverHIS019_0201330 [Cutaneotrichosporon cavernicola]BEI96546.1 hypothetical protein CcaverHIS631_0201350 [Cutaneotrichosporon cavernicola]BEJ04318.1 hypothetical protein CcaverHIS641_0201350 [Cutaneotrichosporon cavernicola]
MSAPATDLLDLPATPPATTLPLLFTSSGGSNRTRSRDEFDADSEGEPASSPHPPKMPRTSQVPEATPEEDTDGPSDPTLRRLMEELECGMCAGLYIDPVSVNGCGHTFCGSCVTQWIKSLPRFPPVLLPGDPVPDPIACPQCRHSPIQIATPSRMAKTMASVLLQAYPGAARPPNEIVQAEALYNPFDPARGVLKFPTPPPASRMHERDYWRPCRWCYTEGDGWKCPVPVPRFDVPAERSLCIRADGVPPEGHRLCAGCERLSPANAPTSSSCGLCGEGFCGDAQTNCDCSPASQSKPSNQYNMLAAMLEDGPSDMLSMAFKDNWTEMYNLGIYLAANSEASTTPLIYKDILGWLRSPEGIDSGGVLGLMTRADIGVRLRSGAANEMQQCVMPVEGGTEEENICSNCSDELLCSGIFEWWMRQLQKPEVADKMPGHIKGRPNCKFGRKCARQEHDIHSKKYNHICDALPTEEAEKIQQDDTMPAGTMGGPNEPGPSRRPQRHILNGESDSDDESDGGTDTDDEDDRKANYVDVGTQWEPTPTGTAMTVGASPIHAAWRWRSEATATPAATTLTFGNASPPPVPVQSQPAVAIANLIHEVNTAPSPSNSRLLLSLRQASPRISGSASSALAGSPSTVAPHLVFNDMRRAQTPPLGMSQIANYALGPNADSASSSPPHSTGLLKLAVPVLKSLPTPMAFDAFVGGGGEGGGVSEIVGGSSIEWPAGSSLDID